MNTLYLKHLVSIVLFLALISGNAFANQSWKFKVYLDEQEIGEHTFNVSSINNKTHVAINAEFDVYFLFIHAYSYQHSNYEVWDGQCLQSARSNTNDNGDEFYVQAQYASETFNIKTPSGQYSVEGCLKTFAYWDPEFLSSQRLLNTQTGEIKDVSIEKIGEEHIMVRGKLTATKHYRLTTDEFVIDLWYSKNNKWLALNSTTKSGSVLEYRIQ